MTPQLSDRARQLLDFIEERQGNWPMGDHAASTEDVKLFGITDGVTPQLEAKGISRANVEALDELIRAGLVASHVVDVWDPGGALRMVDLVWVYLRRRS